MVEENAIGRAVSTGFQQQIKVLRDVNEICEVDSGCRMMNWVERCATQK
jgi:hypothetical protein